MHRPSPPDPLDAVCQQLTGVGFVHVEGVRAADFTAFERHLRRAGLAGQVHAEEGLTGRIYRYRDPGTTGSERKANECGEPPPAEGTEETVPTIDQDRLRLRLAAALAIALNERTGWRIGLVLAESSDPTSSDRPRSEIVDALCVTATRDLAGLKGLRDPRDVLRETEGSTPEARIRFRPQDAQALEAAVAPDGFTPTEWALARGFIDAHPQRWGLRQPPPDASPEIQRVPEGERRAGR